MRPRKAAARALAAIDPEILIGVLAHWAGSGESAEGPRAAAAWALGEKEYVGAVRPLIKALDDGGEELVVASAEALGRIGDKSAVATLVGLLKHPSDEVRRVAMEAIEAIQRKLHQKSVRRPTLLKDEA